MSKTDSKESKIEGKTDLALADLRNRIDTIDDALLRLLAERAKLAQAVGGLKVGAIYRPEREAQVLTRIAATNPGPLSATAVRTIFREIMSACLALEQALRVAYLGPAGTFSESAALRQFGTAPDFLPQATIDEVFRAVESGAANYGVVPVENSSEGAVGRTLDLLMQTPLQICGEIVLPVHQNLMAQTKEMAAIKTVYSHAQSLAQCHGWLGQHLPQALRVSVASNAEAARLAAQSADAGAIAGERAATQYGLPILAANIEDDPDNCTRFIVLSRHDAGPTGHDRTSLICSAPNRAGSVHDLLVPLKKHGVSMCKFESRPARGLSGIWEYVFFIDLEGHREDHALVQALRGINEVAGFARVLGSYPRAPLLAA